MSEITYISPSDIPKSKKGKTGRNWNEIFDNIPLDQTAVLGSAFGSGSNVRMQARKYNKNHKDNLTIVSREVNDEIIVYVTRIKK